MCGLILALSFARTLAESGCCNRSISVLFEAPETAAGMVMIIWILAVELSYAIGISVPLGLPPEMFSTAEAINAICLFFVPPYVL